MLVFLLQGETPTLQKTARVDLTSRKLLLLTADLPFNDAGRLGPRKALVHSSLWQASWCWEEDGTTSQRKDILMAFCCYYYLNQLILISVNVTESLHEQKTNPLVMFAELIFFFGRLFLPHAPIHICLIGGFFCIFWILFAILQLNCWFSTFSILQSPLLQIKTHHFPLLGTTQVTPQGRTWWEQGGRDLCLPIPPPQLQLRGWGTLIWVLAKVGSLLLPYLLHHVYRACCYPGWGWLIQC